MSQFKTTFTLSITFWTVNYHYEMSDEFKNSDPSLDYEARKSLVNKRLFDDHNKYIEESIRKFYRGAHENDNLECTFEFNGENYVCRGQNEKTCIDYYLYLSTYMYRQAQHHEIFCEYGYPNQFMDITLSDKIGFVAYLGDDLIT